MNIRRLKALEALERGTADMDAPQVYDLTLAATDDADRAEEAFLARRHTEMAEQTARQFNGEHHG